MRSLPTLLPRHVALDLRAGAVYWVESGWTPGGWGVRRHGRDAPRDGEAPREFFQRLGRSRRLRGASLSLAIRHPDLRLERVTLPGLSEREARLVGARRVRELMGGLYEFASADFVVARQDRHAQRARCVWLMCCPEEFTALAERQWLSQGLDVSSFVALPIALGCLVRMLPPPEDETLRALVDFGAEHASCVVTDADGWVFSRETSVKVTGDPQDPDRDEAQPVERIATELRRTFHYVRTELAAGAVTELVVSGERGDLVELARDLETRLELPVRLLGDAITEGPMAGVEPVFGAALGIALHAEVGGGNLLPRPSQRARDRRLAKRRLLLAAALSGLAVVAGAAHLGLSLSDLRDRSAALERRWQAAAGRRAQAETVSRARSSAGVLDDVLRTLASSQPPWASALESLGLLLPDEALVEELRASPEAEGWRVSLTLEFRGDDLANAAADATRFTEALGSSPLWRIRSVERRPSNAPPADAGVRVGFAVEADVAGLAPGDATVLAARDRGDADG